MRHLLRLVFSAFAVYAVGAATPEQQARMIDGALAVKDAAFSACTRPEGLCSRVFSHAASAVGRSLWGETRPPAERVWLDDPARRPAPDH